MNFFKRFMSLSMTTKVVVITYVIFTAYFFYGKPLAGWAYVFLTYAARKYDKITMVERRRENHGDNGAG